MWSFILTLHLSLLQRGTLTVGFDIFKISCNTDKRKQLQKLVSNMRYFLSERSSKILEFPRVYSILILIVADISLACYKEFCRRYIITLLKKSISNWIPTRNWMKIHSSYYLLYLRNRLFTLFCCFELSEYSLPWKQTIPFGFAVCLLSQWPQFIGSKEASAFRGIKS